MTTLASAELRRNHPCTECNGEGHLQGEECEHCNGSGVEPDPITDEDDCLFYGSEE